MSGRSDSLNIRLDPTRTGQDADLLANNLRRLIVGQDEAVQAIVNVYQIHLTGMHAPNRPVGNFLFLGPTGSGKTRIVEATAESLVNNPLAVIKIDCAEFQHSHEIAKLLGSPPGYLGHRDTPPLLSQEAVNKFQTETCQVSFVLFDEIEKASDALWNLLLGILDKATFTLGDNRRVDFSRAMIFMTSNLGAAERSLLLSPKMGFAGDVRPSRVDGKLAGKLARTGVEAARRKFTPEFMNRLDKIVVFQSLGESELRKILDIELGYVQTRILAAPHGRAFVFTLGDRAKDHLLAEGISLEYGARHLKRAIERLLVQPMSNLIATAQVNCGDLLFIDYISGPTLTFIKQAEGLAAKVMAQWQGLPKCFTQQTAAGSLGFKPKGLLAASATKRG